MRGGVLLIGLRGAGKSTVAPILARRLGLACHDADALVERATGRSIAELFAGGRFREEEAAVLARLLAAGPSVVAAGGGAIRWKGLESAAADWCVAWLDADPRILAERISGDPGRPSLTGRAPQEEIFQVARRRRAAYRSLASLRVDTGSATPEEVAESIVRFLRDVRGA